VVGKGTFPSLPPRSWETPPLLSGRTERLTQFSA
jgi:hypothetical protein